MTQQQTIKEASQTLVAGIKQIQLFADQTAVHRKKFEFALSQLKKFVEGFAHSAKENLPTPQQSAAIESFKSTMKDFQNLLRSNLLQTWSSTTIESPANSVAEQLHYMFIAFKHDSSKLDPVASLEINPDSLLWGQYNILDLKAIMSSFSQYLGSDEMTDEISSLIRKRLESIDKILHTNADNDVIVNRTFSPIPVHYQSWRVNASDFDEIKDIGGGVSARVFYGIDKRTGKEVAIKKFKFQQFNGPKLQSFQRELATLANANHPTLLHMIGATDTIPYSIITEWMPNSSLYHDLHVHHHLDQTGKTIAAFDIARGMAFLHANQIVHRDLKSLNILLDADNRIRICDFGFSRHASEDSKMTQNIGTPHWMAPELLGAGSNYTNKVDVYAYGIVLWELVTSQTPYNGLDAIQIISQVSHHDLRPAMPPDLNTGMRDLIQQCWDRNPSVRPSFDEIVKRISSGEAVLNGCNIEALQQYITDNETSIEQRTRDINDVLSKLKDGQISATKAFKEIKKKPIPSDLLQEIWENGKLFKPVEVDFLALFKSSSKMSHAAKRMRELPRNSIPASIMSDFVTEIPTGRRETDTDLVVAACRNGVADLCVLYATNPVDIALALDVVTKNGIDKQLKAAVVDRCVIFLKWNDPSLTAATLRCMLTLEEYRRIPQNALADLLGNADTAISGCAYIALTKLAMEGGTIYPDLLTFILNEWINDPRAALAVVAVCKDKKCAEIVLNKIEKEHLGTSEDALKVLLHSAQHNELRGKIKDILEKEKVAEALPQQSECIQKLYKIVSQ